MPSVILRFTFSNGYPSENGPKFDISAPTLRKDQYSELLLILRNLCEASVGTPVIYSMIETIRSFLGNLSDGADVATPDVHETSVNACIRKSGVETIYTLPSVRDHVASVGRRLPLAFGVICPTIYHGDIVTDRKSVFQAHCCRVSSLPEVSAFISTVLEDKKVSTATHNIAAWYLRTKINPNASKASLVADYDDDGEAHAGGRLLHFITMACVDGVAVMVTRWFGGIHLGPDRFRHINNAASQLLTQQGLTKGTATIPSNQTKTKDRVKKRK
ncbi:unnamed protein product [Mesocestoides corti]|nr:unnamed protein product [Mesocestoides corti]